MTPEEQAEGLQARIDPDRVFFRFFVDSHQTVSVMTNGRVGIMTDYWMRPNPEGQSAAFSIGSDTDDYAIFAELEQRIADRILTGIRIMVGAVNSEPNIAISAIATNSTFRNAHGDAVGNVPLLLRGLGIALDEAVDHFAVGKLSGGPYRQVWPQFE